VSGGLFEAERGSGAIAIAPQGAAPFGVVVGALGGSCKGLASGGATGAEHGIRTGRRPGSFDDMRRIKLFRLKIGGPAIAVPDGQDGDLVWAGSARLPGATPPACRTRQFALPLED